MPQIIFSKEEAEKMFYTALCNTTAGSELSGFGLQLDWNDEDYKIARTRFTGDCCLEDVLMKILQDGGKLFIKDIEGDGEYDNEITLEKIHQNIDNLPLDTTCNYIIEADDATDALNLLQIITYNEIIFG